MASIADEKAAKAWKESQHCKQTAEKATEIKSYAEEAKHKYEECDFHYTSKDELESHMSTVMKRNMNILMI